MLFKASVPRSCCTSGSTEASRGTVVTETCLSPWNAATTGSRNGRESPGVIRFSRWRRSMQASCLSSVSPSLRSTVVSSYIGRDRDSIHNDSSGARRRRASVRVMLSKNRVSVRRCGWLGAVQRMQMARMAGRLDGRERRCLTKLAGARSLMRCFKDGAGPLVLCRPKLSPYREILCVSSTSASRGRRARKARARVSVGVSGYSLGLGNCVRETRVRLGQADAINGSTVLHICGPTRDMRITREVIGLRVLNINPGAQ
ncbi:hypothetical protein B0H14DRAFT_1565937 [Mycena olivaceomarginata]|nr:hypothetical protein B0H14DRAFT_1565937 [Mycena olivaceomarginata]